MSYFQKELFEYEEDISFEYLSVNDFLFENLNIEDKDDLEKIKKIKDQATSFYIANENKKSILIFDANDFIKLNYKNVIHFIVATLMDMQNIPLFVMSSTNVREFSIVLWEIEPNTSMPACPMPVIWVMSAS